MNVKTLLFPLSIALALAGGIFWIKPEISAVLVVRDRAQGILSQLEEVRSVKRNIETRAIELENHLEDESLVRAYLPSASSDDHILDRINLLAGELELALLSTTLGHESNSASQEAVVSEGEVLPSGEIPLEGGASAPLVYEERNPSSRTQMTMATVSLRGQYSQIKNFLEMLYHINVMSTVASVSLESATENSSEGESVPAGTLDITLLVHFPYLEELPVAEGVLLSIFQESANDFSVVSDIRDRISRTIDPLPVVPSPRTNPFVR